jgi:hypothetical protein
MVRSTIQRLDRVLEQIGRGLRSRMLEIMHQDSAFAMLLQLAITDRLTCSGLRILKSKESKSAEKIPILRLPRYSISSGGCSSAGKRKYLAELLRVRRASAQGEGSWRSRS